jgi:transcriptional regulator with XRE-family HTH domain
MRRVVPLPFPVEPVINSARELGCFVRAARTQSGLTLENAALATGISKQTLQDLETGKPTVSLGLTLRVAQELGVALFAQPAQDKERSRRRLLQDDDGAA